MNADAFFRYNFFLTIAFLERMHTLPDNRITRALGTIKKFPRFMRGWVRDAAFGRSVPYVGSTGVRFLKMEPQEWVALVPNRRRARNHIRQVHAGAMIVAAETVAVMMTAMHLPNDRIPLVKRIDAQFVKRSEGDIHAVARLREVDIRYIRETPKGELEIEVEVTDEEQKAPVLVRVTSAWVPKEPKTP